MSQLVLEKNNLYELPDNSGHIFFQHVIAPHLLYCPSASSIKNNGNPSKKIIIVYGIRKAPKLEYYTIN